MKKRLSLAILALLTITLLAVGCPRVWEIEPPPQGPYPAPAKQWSRTFGGPYSETAQSVYQTACGGFIIVGETESFGAGKTDFWLVKTDAQGNEEWSQTFGGAEWDAAFSVQQTTCGGFIIAGSTDSCGAGKGDVWLIKTDEGGNKEWSRTFGGKLHDGASSVQQTRDGGFIIAGSTDSFGAGGSDFWLVKTDPQGNKEWSRTFGGPDWDEAHSVQQTACGGFIIAGSTRSFARGDSDFWLVKTDPQGDKEWSQTLGGNAASSVQQTACGGFVIGGTTDFVHRAGRSDFWLVRTDPQGNREWRRSFGGPELDLAASVKQTTCGGFVIAGTITTLNILLAVPTGVPPPTPIPCIWVVKTDRQGNIEWTQTFGTPRGWDSANSIKQTACGGFIIAGSTDSFGAGKSDFWLIKLAPEQ
ncbi:hypothetical protein M1O16_02180 [Dehalococcoidia bacterium]|nr:hypothetical protein [Dehalococcoidia bacterium]